MYGTTTAKKYPFSTVCPETDSPRRVQGKQYCNIWTGNWTIAVAYIYTTRRSDGISITIGHEKWLVRTRNYNTMYDDRIVQQSSRRLLKNVIKKWHHKRTRFLFFNSPTRSGTQQNIIWTTVENHSAVYWKFDLNWKIAMYQIKTGSKRPSLAFK